MPLIPVPGMPGFFFPGGMLEAEAGLYSDSVESGLTPTWLTWRGLLIAPRSDTNTPFHLSDISGWDVTPQISFEDVKRAGGRGVAVTAGEMGPRIITVTGWCFDQQLRNQLLAMLNGYAAPSVGSLETSPLEVTHAGLTLTVDAQLLKADATADVGWGTGRFAFTMQWRCADPVKYGARQNVFAPVLAPTTGLTYPVTYPITYPAAPPSGQAVVVNSGNAPADVVFSLAGPLNNSPGVTVLSTGEKVWFGFDLANGDVITIDTAQGACLLNGEFRAPAVGSSLLADLRLPPGSSTVQVLGDAGGSGAPGGYVSFRPAFW